MVVTRRPTTSVLDIIRQICGRRGREDFSAASLHRVINNLGVSSTICQGS